MSKLLTHDEAMAGVIGQTLTIHLAGAKEQWLWDAKIGRLCRSGKGTKSYSPMPCGTRKTAEGKRP